MYIYIYITIWSVTSSFFFFAETKAPPTPRPGMGVADYVLKVGRLKVGRLAGTRRLMIQSSEPSPNYLTTNQSEKSPSTLIPNVVLKRHFLKVIREFGSFEHELPFFLAWHPANKRCTFLYNLVSVDWLCCAAGEQTQVRFGNISILVPLKQNKNLKTFSKPKAVLWLMLKNFPNLSQFDTQLSTCATAFFWGQSIYFS